MSQPTRESRKDHDHSLLQTAEDYARLLAEEALETGESIVEGMAGAAHKVWDRVMGSHEEDQGAAKGKSQSPAKTTEPAPDNTETSTGPTLADALQHVAELKKEAGQPEGKTPPAKNSGLKKTQGPEDLVATFGTVAEAGQQLGNLTVYYCDGLKLKPKLDKQGHPVLGKDGKPKLERTNEAKEDAELEKEAMRSSTIPVHRKIAPLFQEIFDAIKAGGDWRHILERPWSYTPRENRNNATEWSIHSWGTAIDVNAITNPNGVDGATEHQKKIEGYFTSRNFTWLLHSDAMHFQYHDGGAPKISDADIADIKAGKVSGTNVRTLIVDVNNSLKKARAKLAKAKREPEKQRHQARIDRLEEMLKLLQPPVG